MTRLESSATLEAPAEISDHLIMSNLLNPSDTFIHRHVGPDASEVQDMLTLIGCSTLDDLVDKAVPSSIRMTEPLKLGLPRDLATELSAQTLLGASAMVLATKEHPAKLKDVVTTPAGCTIDGLLELEQGGLRVTLIKAVVRAAARAKQLAETQNS